MDTFGAFRGLFRKDSSAGVALFKEEILLSSGRASRCRMGCAPRRRRWHGWKLQRRATQRRATPSAAVAVSSRASSNQRTTASLWSVPSQTLRQSGCKENSFLLFRNIWARTSSLIRWMFRKERERWRQADARLCAVWRRRWYIISMGEPWDLSRECYQRLIKVPVAFEMNAVCDFM